MIDTYFFLKLSKTRQEKFPEATWESMLKKCATECTEAIGAPKSKRLEEYADIGICWLGAIDRDGYSLLEVVVAMHYKDAVNQRRAQALLPDGTYQHVPEE